MATEALTEGFGGLHLGDACAIHDFDETFFDDKVHITFRVLNMPRFLWIWVGDAPCVTNLSAHVTRPNVQLPSCSRLIEGDRCDFGTSISNRLSKKLPEKVVHFAWHLKPDLARDPALSAKIEARIVKELRGLAIMPSKPRTA
eukprot:TRINITY_DN4424_c0_g1_i1.p2 TRINITY_DN4424_c0_g1~~TRINITY_DN4424_c0_g1_i1.p2  ORF type:complete len:143 (+),score=32.53 TRINITY_DN4424_c0_g1_i1:909-1337(+)